MSKTSSVVGSFLWKASERLIVQGCGLLVQVILARLLLPEDFACLAIITAIVNYLGLFVQSGLSIVVVQKKDLSKIDIATLTSISLLVALILFVGLFFFAPAISGFYNVGDIIWPIRIMGLSLFLYSFNSIQTGLLQRKMQFRSIFYRSLLATPLSGVIGIVMAYMGLGIWALIGYSISNILLIVIFMNLIPELRLSFGFSWKSAKDIYSFSLKILGTSLVSAGGDTIRTLTIGKAYTPNQLAYFDRGLSYSGLVTQVVNTSLSSVLLSVFSRKQDEQEQLLTMARKSVHISSFVMIPVLTMVALLSKSLVFIILTEKWIPCALYLSLFCFLRIPGIITSIDKQAYYALGKSQIGLYYEIGLLAANLFSLVIMMPYGVLAIAVGFIVIEYIGNFCLFLVSNKIYNYRLKYRLHDMVKPLFNTIVMSIVVWLLGKLNCNIYVMTLLQIFVGLVLYVIFSYLTNDEALCFILNRIKKSNNKF